MKPKIIYSIYINIKDGDLVDKLENKVCDIPKHTKNQFLQYKDYLVSKHKEYANNLGIEYKLFEYDESYEEYKLFFKDNYPHISEYNIINFYKIYLMYKLSNDYDEILYLDLDVVPCTTDSFFDAFDLQKTIAIRETSQTEYNLPRTIIEIKKNTSVRSPIAKYWNLYAMLHENDIIAETPIFNTGIIGASSTMLKKLDYFGSFRDTLDLMDDLKFSNELWPAKLKDLFGWDNETVWGYKTVINKINYTELDDDWHYFMNSRSFIPKSAKLAHIINKDFDYVKTLNF